MDERPDDQADEPSQQPRSRPSSSLINTFGGYNPSEIFGLHRMVEDIFRTISPYDQWNKELTKLIQGVQWSAAPSGLSESYANVVGTSALKAFESFQDFGLSSVIETIHAQQTLLTKGLWSPVDFGYVPPLLPYLSWVTEAQKTVFASSAIQNIVAQSFVDIDALLDVNPTKTMVEDIFKIADLSATIDLASILPNAFGVGHLSTIAKAATAAQRAAAAAEDEDAEDAALEAIRQVFEDDQLDADAAEREEQFQTVMDILARVRPGIGLMYRETLRASSLAVLVYLSIHDPGVLNAVLKWVGMLSFAGYNLNPNLLVPRAYRPDSDD